MKLAHLCVGAAMVVCASMGARGPVFADEETGATDAGSAPAEGSEMAAETAAEMAASDSEMAAESDAEMAESDAEMAAATEAEGGEGIACTGDVDCTEVDDPKLHRRSGKSYWGVATKKRPPELTVLEKSLDQFQRAYCGMADDWEINMFLGMVHAELADLALDERERDQAMAHFRCVGPAFTRAIELAEDEDDREQAQENREHYWVDQYNEALELYKSEGFALAAEAAEIALLIDPSDCRGYTILGSSLASQAKYGDAVEVLEKGHELCPDNDNLAENLFAARHNRGNEIFNQARTEEEFQQAAVHYRKAAEIHPDDLGNLYYLGTSNLQIASRGDSTAIEPARQAFERFLELTDSREDRTAGLYNLALLEIEAKNWEAADGAANGYIQLNPLDPDGYALKSRVLVNSQRTKEAEPFIIMTNALRNSPVAEADPWCDEAQQRYGSKSDFTTFVGANGCPEQVYVHEDSNGNEMVAALHPGQNKVVAYYAGSKKGEFDVQAESLQAEKP